MQLDKATSEKEAMARELAVKVRANGHDDWDPIVPSNQYRPLAFHGNNRIDDLGTTIEGSDRPDQSISEREGRDER